MSRPLAPSGEAAEPGTGPGAALLCLVALVLAAHLAVAAGLHLTEDEAYYRLWSRAPALGYYDHPPMIAWWIAAGRWLAGDTPLGVRLLPCLASAATSLLVYAAARLGGFGLGASRWAAIGYNLMPLVLLGGALAVPDSPASLFWAATLAAALRAVSQSEKALPWWAAAGAAAGLACLSKYSALFLGPGVLLWLGWRRETRGLLRTPGPWLALAIAGGLFGLNVAWNATHHWLSFAKQFGRVAPSAFTAAEAPVFLITQILLLNPALALLAIRARGATILPFVATSAPFALYLLLHSLHAKVEAHWPAPIYAAVAILAAAAGAAVGGASMIRRAAMAIAAGLVGLSLIVLVSPGALTRKLTRPVRDWPAFAGRVEAERRASGAAWVGVLSYGLAAELADEPAIHAPVAQLSERVRYDGLGLPPPDLSRPGLVIDLQRRMGGARLGDCFVSVTPAAPLTRGSAGEGGTAYAAVLVAGPRAPAPGC